MIQFPEKFQERMQQMLGDEEYAEFLKSYDLPFHNGLRINTWKTKPRTASADGCGFEAGTHGRDRILS